MKKLKIVGWTSFDSDYPTPKLDSEGLKLYLEVIKNELKKKRYYFSGEEHQNSLVGVPVFNDGTCFRASMRAWGSIMANAHTDKKDQYTYMDFYMDNGGFTRFPKLKPIKVTPALVSETSVGCTSHEDIRILEECKAYGMPFMTTDKVLEKLAAKTVNLK